MSSFEYHVVAAPRKGKSGKGVKGGPAKFANAIRSLMNEMAADGWEYLRADTLPCEERQGLTSKTVKYHSMLVFRRPVADEEVTEAPLALTHQEEVVPRKEPALRATPEQDETDATDAPDVEDEATENAPAETTFASSRSTPV